MSTARAPERINDTRYYAQYYMQCIMLGNQGPVHTTPNKFENATLFLRFGLSSTLIRINCPPKATENGTFRKRSPE